MSIVKKEENSTVWQNARTVIEDGVEYGWTPTTVPGEFHIASRVVGTKDAPICLLSAQDLDKLSPDLKQKVCATGIFRGLPEVRVFVSSIPHGDGAYELYRCPNAAVPGQIKAYWVLESREFCIRRRHLWPQIAGDAPRQKFAELIGSTPEALDAWFAANAAQSTGYTCPAQ